MNIRVILTAVVLAALVSAGQADAQGKKMYRWTDEDGVVHYSDTPPDNREAEVSDLPSAEAKTAASPYGQPADGPSVAERRREEIARSHDQAREEQARMQAQCEAWRAEVARLEPHRRVYFTNEEGETERMDDIERTNRVAELKAQIEQDCR
jgi:hypothetical protein